MIRHHVLTLTGSAQALSSIADALKLRIRTISLQPGGGNANPVYVGDALTTVTSSSYGVRLEAAATGVPPAPFVLGEFAPGWGDLSEIVVLGTNTEKLHVLIDYYN